MDTATADPMDEGPDLDDLAFYRQAVIDDAADLRHELEEDGEADPDTMANLSIAAWKVSLNTPDIREKELCERLKEDANKVVAHGEFSSSSLVEVVETLAKLLEMPIYSTIH